MSALWVRSLAAILCGALCAGAGAQVAHEPPPVWAFAVDPPSEQLTTPAPGPAPALAADDTPRYVPGSAAAFTLAQIDDLFNVPDWHPSDHAAMPEVVSRGSAPELFACGYCHLPNGLGRPENASLAGLPVGYIERQIAAFSQGLRKSSEPRDLPAALMITVASSATAQDIDAAAQYFSALKPQPWIRVVEARSVARMQVSGWMLVPAAAGGMEAIGARILETPENLERTELRDDRSGFIAYVPRGGISKGRALVSSGGAGKTIACAICHGLQLRGLGNVPALAGRSPSYIVRQLYDIQSGARAAVDTQLMKAVVARLSVSDMVSIAAYTASLAP